MIWPISHTLIIINSCKTPDTRNENLKIASSIQDYQPTAELACFLLTSDTVKIIELLNKIMLGDIISLILFFFIVDTFT